MKKSILILVGTLLYPARRNGTSVRYFPLVRALRERGVDVDIIVINKYRESFTDEDIRAQEGLCSRLDIIDVPENFRSPPAHFARRVFNTAHRILPFGVPYETLDSNREYYRSELDRLVSGRPRYDVAIGIDVWGNNADMLLSLDAGNRPAQVICDFIDSAYLLRKRGRKGLLPGLNPLALLEDAKIRKREQSICRKCVAVYITERDARTAAPCDARVIPNSIVGDGYAEAGEPGLESPNIGFLGTMSYPPNDKAATYLVDELFPALKKRHPDIKLYIIGRNPTASLLEKSAHPDIHVVGNVENIWDYIRSVDVFVFPMLSGAGQQNKVLEAMYAGKVVVTSAIANEGIDAKHGHDLLIADTKQDYLDHIGTALGDMQAMQANARRFVDEHFSEAGFIRKYLDIMDL